MHIWTQDDLRSEASHYKADCWRFVEAQHVNSTRKLVDSDDEQKRLEQLVEATKPPIPLECSHLNYLLSTPFRYQAIHPTGSRFRSATDELGVYYAAENETTAAAEMAFIRLLFFAESPNTGIPTVPFNYTAFSVGVADENMIDLTRGELASEEAVWNHLTDYEPCQQLAVTARQIKSQIIKYQSVRDPDQQMNLAVLNCKAFTDNSPKNQNTWQFLISSSGVVTRREFPVLSLQFDKNIFMNDPRLQDVDWSNK